MREMSNGEGTYIANWFAQRWAIEAELRASEEQRPKLPDSPELKGAKGGATDPIGEFEDDPAFEHRRLLGELGIDAGG
jgi:hypothetical protein